jgi:hypothetical protein
MKKSLLAVLAVVVLLSGCANLTSPAREHSLDATKQYWFDYDATRRGAVMVPSTAMVKMCSEPSPDAALNLVSKLDASLEKTGVGKAEGSAEFNASVVKLAERTQVVMFLREALFRLCEQSLNQQFTKDEILSAYNKVIDTAKAIADADRDKAKAAAASAVKSLSAEQLKALQ